MDLRPRITKAQGEFLNSKAKVTSYEGGLGAGKTRILCAKAIQKALLGRIFLLVSFSYTALTDTVFKTLIDLLETDYKGLPYKKTASTGKMNVFIGKGEIRLRTGIDPDKLRGPNVHDWGIDEAREFKDDYIYKVLIGRARIDEYAQGFIASTTKGRNWVYELGKRPDSKVIRQTTFDNPFLPESYKNFLKQEYSGKFAQQELYADIVDMGAGVIDPNWFKVIPIFKPLNAVRFWDLAVSTKTHADYTAGALCSFNDNFIIHNINRMKKEWPDVKKEIVKTAHKDGVNVTIYIEESGQQLGFIQELRRLPELRQFTVKSLRPDKDKFTRALPWASRAESGNVHLCYGGWIEQFKEECSSFSADDSHIHDDQVDAVSGAYEALNKNVGYKVHKVRI